MSTQTSTVILAAYRVLRQHRVTAVTLVMGLACGGMLGGTYQALQSRIIEGTRPSVIRDTRLVSVTTVSLPTMASSASSKSAKMRRDLLQERVKQRVKAAPIHRAAPRKTIVPSQPIYGPLPAPAISTEQSFPAFGNAIYPVSRVPNWGAMHSAAEWNRTYAQLGTTDFVAVPRYDMQKLLMPFKEVVAEKDEAAITSKLFYSTKYYGKYDLDAKEYTAAHPGIDLKLALGTPIGSLAGGRVHDVRKDAILGLHVIIEHRHPTAGTFYSIYGHLGSTSVTSGQDVQAGQIIGTVGLTGNTSGPHLHLQVDRGSPGESYHVVFLPHDVPSPGEADAHTVHPIHFIEQY